MKNNFQFFKHKSTYNSEMIYFRVYSYIVFLPKFIVYDNFLVSYFILMLIYVQDMWQY